jgi:hypothetical protein
MIARGFTVEVMAELIRSGSRQQRRSGSSPGMRGRRDARADHLAPSLGGRY